MRIVFMGTSEFAVPSLRALLEAGHEIAGVWTRADKPHGRGHHLDVSPIKHAALDAGLALYQPTTLKKPENAAEVTAISPDIVCVAAYGLILPPVVLAAPRLGCVNVHASLLPKYRGAAPIHRAIMAGETSTGVTTMMMDEGLDTGDELLEERTAIGPDETYGDLHDRLSEIGARLLVETIARLERSDCPRQPQDNAEASYAPPVRKEECEIDWNQPVSRIHNRVRGVNPRPGAFTLRAGTILRIHQTRPHPGETTEEPGRILNGRRGLFVACGAGVIELLVVQPAGKKPMPAADYLRGRPAQPGERLGV